MVNQEKKKKKEPSEKDKFVIQEYNETTEIYTLKLQLPSSALNFTFNKIDIVDSKMSIENALFQIDKVFASFYLKMMRRLKREVSNTLAELGVREKNLLIHNVANNINLKNKH